MASDRVVLGVVTDAQNAFAQMLLALGCKLAAAQDRHEPKLYLAILCDDHAAGTRHTIDILAALLRTDRRFRRQLRLGRWRGRLLPDGGEVLFWEGVEVVPLESDGTRRRKPPDRRAA